MNLYINQPWGLGDVIYCQTLANNWIAEGHTVTWGVFPQFVDGLTRAYPNVKFVDWRTVKINYDRQDEHDDQGYRVVPLRFNVEIMGVPYTECMRSKYTMFNLDYQDWRKGATWLRDGLKELELRHLLTLPPAYNLINNIYGSESQLRAAIKPENGLPNIYMSTHPGYSLFDWRCVIENATEIHVVSSSILYILEMLDLNMPIHLYPRQGDPKFKQVDYLFTKPYILH